MVKKIKLMISLLVISIVVIYINYEISSYNMNFYHGKDNGDILRVESVCVMSALFYFFMSDKRLLGKMAQLIVGFLIGILSSFISFIIGYYISSIVTDTDVMGFLIHVLACTLFITGFFIIKKHGTSNKGGGQC